jgi:hypothetical protein
VTDKPSSREVAGLFADRDSFQSAVDDLMAAGFERSDLSVLSSHESIDAAGKPGRSWREVLTGLIGEIKYEVPLVASGAVVLVGGPVAATLAGVIGAATAGVAAKELIDEVTATPDTEDFARALAAGGVILWVNARDDAAEQEAARILAAAGGTNVHAVDF